MMQPDIVAPGALVLSADITNGYFTGFAINMGTSYSAPAIAGILILLKSLHPDWSPAALKSAIMTTGSLNQTPFSFFLND